MTTTHGSRWTSGVLAGGLLLLPLTACSNGNGSTTAASSSATVASTTAQPTGATESSGAGGSTGATASASTSGDVSDVHCSGKSCSVTISGKGKANVLGTNISLGAVQDGRATLAVGNRSISCSQGESRSAGPLTLKCTTVTADSVTLTASLG